VISREKDTGPSDPAPVVLAELRELCGARLSKLQDKMDDIEETLTSEEVGPIANPHARGAESKRRRVEETGVVDGVLDPLTEKARAIAAPFGKEWEKGTISAFEQFRKQCKGKTQDLLVAMYLPFITPRSINWRRRRISSRP